MNILTFAFIKKYISFECCFTFWRKIFEKL